MSCKINEKESCMGEISPDKKIDSGLFCVLNIANFHGIGLDPVKLRHDYALTQNLNEVTMQKVARDAGLKVRFIKSNIKRLNKTPMPVIARLKSGGYIIVAKVDNDRLLVLEPVTGTRVYTIKEFIEIWDLTLMLAIPRHIESQGKQFGLGWFIPTILKYKKILVEVILASFMMQILGITAPMITQVVIDKVLNHNALTTLDVLVFALIVSSLFETAMTVARGYVFTNMTSKIDVTLGARLFKHLFALPLAYFESRRVGDTVARVRELENIRNFLTGSPLTAILDFMFIFVYLIVMLFYSKTLTLLVVLSLPFFVVLSAVVTPIFRKRLDEKFNTGAENQSYLVESVSGVQTIKAFALEPKIQRKWESNLANYVKSGYKTSVLSNNAGAISQLISKISDIIILWYGARLVIDGNLTIGQMIAFRMLASRVSGPILRIVSLWQDFQQTRLSVQRVGDIFNTRPEPAMESAKTRLPAIAGKITFEHVRFRYRPGSPEAIRDMSFEIEPGRVVGIVGRSGSGKSTIAKLIQRLYIPEAGKISIDGIDVSLADPAWLRMQIGVVLQENFLFSGTVKDNIAINKPTASIDEVVAVAKIAGAHEFILGLTEGYDTIVGERGVGLSGGQKQRVAIARALLNNPKVLIFDEATSALDYESESIIQQNLKHICRGRTVIIIAHRLSTLRDANLIISVDRGSLVEYGSHEELMKQNGLYRYLYEQQVRR